MSEPYRASAAEIAAEQFSWGTLRWLCNAKLSNAAEQTFGVCTIFPGCRNPVHYHPNCEELLYVTRGSGRHRLDDQMIELKAGDLLRIPAHVRHNLENTGSEPLDCVISFSSGDRQTVFLEP